MVNINHKPNLKACPQSPLVKLNKS